MPDLFNRNPFNQPYLTEVISTPSELLAYYSFRPFTFVRRDVATPGNVFLLGRKGVGKTMILKLFDTDLVSEIYREQPAYADIMPQLPTATIGVYVHLASALLRVPEFAGREQTVDWWRTAFGDFLNCTFLQALFKNLTTLASIPAWRHDSDWPADALPTNPDIIAAILLALRDESGAFDAITDYKGLAAALRARLRTWARFLNREKESAPPPTPLRLGLPLFRVAEVLRQYQPRLRILLLVDQYEALHSYKAAVDLRPVFNQAMYEASRGGTGVEFKIGCRPYAFGDLKLLGTDATIEHGREVTFVDLDRRASGYFPDFVAELFTKRLQQAGASTLANPKATARHYLPTMSPPDEAKRYVQNARTEPTRHLSAYLDWWQGHGLSEADVAAVVQSIPLNDCHPLVAVLTAIALTRWLSDPSAPQPFLLPAPRSLPHDRRDILIYYGQGLRRALELRYHLGSQKSRKATIERAADDFVGDCEASALFRIASAYKNQRKIYSGFDTIERVSSNVALVFIEIMKTAWDLFLVDLDETKIQPLLPETQSDAVYLVSESWYSRIAREYENGLRQEAFLRGLGSGFRTLQMDLVVRVPAPNAFSIRRDGLEPSPGAFAPAFDLLRELVGWGLLDEAEHHDKTPGRPKRVKYQVNRVLCPYFGLTDIHHKDPIYIRDVAKFVQTILLGRLPDEMRTSQSPDGAQIPLFSS